VRRLGTRHGAATLHWRPWQCASCKFAARCQRPLCPEKPRIPRAQLATLPVPGRGKGRSDAPVGPLIPAYMHACISDIVAHQLQHAKRRLHVHRGIHATCTMQSTFLMSDAPPLARSGCFVVISDMTTLSHRPKQDGLRMPPRLHGAWGVPKWATGASPALVAALCTPRPSAPRRQRAAQIASPRDADLRGCAAAAGGAPTVPCGSVNARRGMRWRVGCPAHWEHALAFDALLPCRPPRVPALCPAAFHCCSASFLLPPLLPAIKQAHRTPRRIRRRVPGVGGKLRRVSRLHCARTAAADAHAHTQRPFRRRICSKAPSS